MDERKRTINELELRKREALRSLGAVYEDFGETLFGRVRGREELLGAGSEEYLRLQKEIADSEGLIRLAETDTLRLKELEGEILAKEREHTALGAEIGRACADLGRDAVEEESLSALLGLYRQQIVQLNSKLEDAQAKLDTLEDGAGTGFFGWIGKNTQQAVYKTLTVKYQGSLKKLYTAAGERLIAAENGAPGLEDAIRSVRDLKEGAQAQVRDLEKLREERRRLGSIFNAEGGPVRRVQNLEKHIAQIRLDLKAVYRRVGELASGEGEGFSEVLESGDSRVLEQVSRTKQALAEYDRDIEKLKTAIAIDEEKAEIEKMRRTIAGERQKISAAEGRIGELETRIEAANGRVEELTRLL
jgi:chromosome segregation ATPase